MQIAGINSSTILSCQEEPFPLGKYGRMKLDYLLNRRRVQFMCLKTTGKLKGYLQVFDRQASKQVQRIVDKMAKADRMDEKLEAEDPMKWTGLINNYKSCAEEIVLR